MTYYVVSACLIWEESITATRPTSPTHSRLTANLRRTRGLYTMQFSKLIELYLPSVNQVCWKHISSLINALNSDVNHLNYTVE